MIELAALATQFVTSVTPYLPALVETGRFVGAAAGASVVDSATKNFGERAWTRLRGVWSMLYPCIEASPAANASLVEILQHPTDDDVVAAFRLQTRQILEAEPNLAEAVAAWLDGIKGTSVSVHAEGERSVAVAGGIQGSTVITGDIGTSPGRTGAADSSDSSIGR